MKKIIFAISAVLAFVIIVSPILLLFSTTVWLPSQFGNTFVGVLDEKYDRLASIEEPKVVVVGGSSVAFGLDSQKMEEQLGMPVVNFGLYAAIGTKAMIDLSRDQIKEGDIVVLAPELDPQTMSMYFSSKNTLEAVDGNYSLALKFDIDTLLSMLGGLWKHGSDKLGYYLTEAPDPTGVYNGKNFNEYGDIVWDDERSEYKFVPYLLDSSSDEDEDGVDVMNSYDGALIFSVSYDGGDGWYPNGGSRVNMDLFKPNIRWTGKRLVWLFYGPSGLGKSTLGAAINGHNVLEIDQLNRLPDAILADVVIIGNRGKFTIDDILPRLYGDPMVIKVGFEKL